MVITTTMKNYVTRNGIYYFRLAVPKGCQSEVGKREILQSLKTSDELEAAVAVNKLTKTWKIKFKAIREGSKEVNAAGSRNETSASLVDPFKQQLSDYVQANVPHYLDSHSREELIECSRFCRDVIIEASKGGDPDCRKVIPKCDGRNVYAVSGKGSRFVIWAGAALGCYIDPKLVALSEDEQVDVIVQKTDGGTSPLMVRNDYRLIIVMPMTLDDGIGEQLERIQLDRFRRQRKMTVGKPNQHTKAEAAPWWSALVKRKAA